MNIAKSLGVQGIKGAQRCLHNVLYGLGRLLSSISLLEAVEPKLQNFAWGSQCDWGIRVFQTSLIGNMSKTFKEYPIQSILEICKTLIGKRGFFKINHHLNGTDEHPLRNVCGLLQSLYATYAHFLHQNTILQTHLLIGKMVGNDLRNTKLVSDKNQPAWLRWELDGDLNIWTPYIFLLKITYRP